MDKKSNENIPCTYCDRDALPNTDPPVCEIHAKEPVVKEASEDKPDTLKELASADK